MLSAPFSKCNCFFVLRIKGPKLDIDTLRSAQSGGAAQPVEDTGAAEARREQRKAAVEARGQLRYARGLNKKRKRIAEGSEEVLSWDELQTLQGLDDGSLRRWSNELTLQSGNGTIYNSDGTTVMLGANTRSITRRVLDGFEPMRPEQLDLTQYT